MCSDFLAESSRRAPASEKDCAVVTVVRKYPRELYSMLVVLTQYPAVDRGIFR